MKNYKINQYCLPHEGGEGGALAPDGGLRLVFLGLALLTMLLTGCKTNIREHYLSKQGNSFYKQENYEEAKKNYSKVTELDPNNPIIHYNMANTLHKEGKSEEAMAEYQEAIKNGSKKVKNAAYYNLGNMNMAKQDYQSAVDNYVKALKLHPKDKESKKNLELALQCICKQKQKPNQSKQNQQKQDQQQNKQKSMEKLMAEKLLKQLQKDSKYKPKQDKPKREQENDW